MSVRISVKGIIIKDGKLLSIVKKDGNSIYYGLPGGGQEKGESIDKALERECEEETGIQVRLKELIYIRDYISGNHEFEHLIPGFHQVELIFLCDIINEMNFNNGSIKDKRQIGIEWLDIKKLEEYNLYPKVLRSLIPMIGKEQQRIYLGDVN